MYRFYWAVLHVLQYNDASNHQYGVYENGLRSDLMVDVKVHELHNVRCRSIRGRLLLEMKAVLQSGKTSVSLPQPILVRPGFFHSIQMSPFPQSHYSELGDIKKEFKLESDIIIRSIDKNCCADDDDDSYEEDMIVMVMVMITDLFWSWISIEFKFALALERLRKYLSLPSI